MVKYAFVDDTCSWVTSKRSRRPGKHSMMMDGFTQEMLALLIPLVGIILGPKITLSGHDLTCSDMV